MINQTPDKMLLDQITDMLRRLDERVDQLESLEPSGWSTIEDINVTVAQATIDFLNIPSTFKHLVIIGLTRTDRVAITDGLALTFNGDGGANYDWMWWDVRHDVASGLPIAGSNDAAGDTQMEQGFFPAATAPANVFGPLQINIPHYTVAAAFKSTFLGGGHLNAQARDNIFSNLAHGVWRDTSVISGITLAPVFGTNFIAGCRFTLAGIR